MFVAIRLFRWAGILATPLDERDQPVAAQRVRRNPTDVARRTMLRQMVRNGAPEPLTARCSVLLRPLLPMRMNPTIETYDSRPIPIRRS
jgi:hypothetical protein